jgi:hypothetical protein
MAKDLPEEIQPETREARAYIDQGKLIKDKEIELG